LLALANFMRLSLMKAAHAAVGGAPWQEIRRRGTKTNCFRCLLLVQHYG
jgi:hypothetical protein